MPVLNTIFTNLKTELLTITTANGYSLNVVEVDHELEPPEDSPLALGKAHITIFDEGEGEPFTQFASGKALNQAIVTLRWKVKSSFGTLPMTEGKQCMSDTIKLLKKPIVLGANFRFADIVTKAGDDISQDQVITDIQIGITYWIDQGSP